MNKFRHKLEDNSVPVPPHVVVRDLSYILKIVNNCSSEHFSTCAVGTQSRIEGSKQQLWPLAAFYIGLLYYRNRTKDKAK